MMTLYTTSDELQFIDGLRIKGSVKVLRTLLDLMDKRRWDPPVDPVKIKIALTRALEDLTPPQCP